MAHEPCMTLTELAREKGVKSSAHFNHWAKRIPLPPQELFNSPKFSRNNVSGKKFYKRSALLDWYERAKP